MNLLIYFCIPLVVTGRTTRGTYGQEDLIGDVEETENGHRSPVEILETESGNPEVSETSESFSNFYPGHIDYSNPELKEYVADHQDGTYYRKGLEEHRAADVAVGRGIAASTGVRGDISHPSFIPSNIYNSLKDKNRNIPLRTLVRDVPAPLHDQEEAVVDPGLAYGLPSSGLGLGLYGNGVNPRYAALLQGQYGQYGGGGQKLALSAAAVPHQHHLQHVSPLQYQAGLVGSSGLLYQQQNPYLHSHSHLTPGPLAYPAGVLAAEDEQLPVAQQVVPTLQAPLVKSAGVPLHLKTAALHAYAPQQQQLLLKAPTLPVAPIAAPLGPLVPLYHSPQLQPTLLKEVVSPSLSNSPSILLQPSHQLAVQPEAAAPLLSPYSLPLLAQQHLALYNPNLLQGPILRTGPIPVPIQLKSLPAAALLRQPVLKAVVGGGLPTPLLKTAPGVEASIVPAIEEEVPAEILGGPVIPTGLIAKAPLQPLYPNLAPEALYLSPKLHHQKVLLRKPAALTEKAVLKAALSSPAYLDRDPHHGHHHHHIQPTKAVLKAPLLAHYVHQDGHYLDPSLPSKILSSQKDLVNALISSDNAGKLYKKGGIIKGAHLEILPSLSYGYSLSMYPNAKGLYGPPKLLDHEEGHHPHSQYSHHHHSDDLHQHHYH